MLFIAYCGVLICSLSLFVLRGFNFYLSSSGRSVGCFPRRSMVLRRPVAISWRGIKIIYFFLMFFWRALLFFSVDAVRWEVYFLFLLFFFSQFSSYTPSFCRYYCSSPHAFPRCFGFSCCGVWGSEEQRCNMNLVMYLGLGLG